MDRIRENHGLEQSFGLIEFDLKFRPLRVLEFVYALYIYLLAANTAYNGAALNLLNTWALRGLNLTKCLPRASRSCSNTLKVLI